jgi:CDP-diacylglycerol--serine O-phosphatidyltransferase
VSEPRRRRLPVGRSRIAVGRRLPGEGRRLRRGAYLLPSLFTIGNMLLGFYAVVWGLRGQFTRAALLVFTAGLLDGLDGRIARMTGTESEFGREYDSLADVVTFGVVPALLVYLWAFGDGSSFVQMVQEDPWARIGWLAPFFYLVCTATRLARFNVQTKVVDARYFVGLPAPAAAGSVCSILFFAPDREWKPWLEALVLVALMLIGALMVSTIRYRSFKQIDLRKPWSYRVALPLAAIVLVVAIHPTATFLVIAVLYTLSGPAAYLAARLRRGHRGEAQHPGEPPAPEPQEGR